jgi:hypothetical protein
VDTDQPELKSVEQSSPAPDLLPRAVAASLLLLAVYWLTVSGAFHSVDEQAVFATARNLAFHGRVDQSTLFWGSPYRGLGRVGLDGEFYAKYGLGHSVLVALVISLARAVPGAGLANTALFVNAMATALTAFFLILSAGRLGYSTRTSLSIGLLFGLATFSWVYTKTMFSDPLVALGWSAVLWIVLARITPRRALSAGLVMAATVAVRPALVLASVPFCLLLWDRNPRILARRQIAFMLPVAVVGLGLLAFNQWRFGDPFQFGYAELFGGSLTAGLFGFLVSLDRSIFVFAPPLVGLFWSVPAFMRQHGSLGWKLLVIAGFVLLLYSTWPVFWGGPVWGPRYLLPILPLLMILLLPAVHRAWPHRGWPRLAMLFLVIAGLAIQLVGVIWNPSSMTHTLGQRYPLWLLRPRTQWLDIAWLHARPGSMLIASGIGLLALAALRLNRRWLLATAVLAGLFGSLLLLSNLGQGWFEYNNRPVYASALSRLVEEGKSGDALLLNPAPYQSPSDALVWFLNQPRASIPFYGVHRLPPGETTRSADRVDHLLRSYQRLWLLTEGVQPGDPASTTERYLIDNAALVGTWWLEDGYRLTLFEASQPPAMSGVVNTPLDGGALLESWEVAWNPAAPASLQLTLRWRTLGPTPEALHVFAQALDDEGTLVAGWDGVPQGGFAPSTGWQAGGSIEDHVALSLPADWPVARLHLIAGLYDTATGQRLTMPDGADAVLLTIIPP